MKITKEQWEVLSYKEQEQFLKRCYICQLKFCPFAVEEINGYAICPYCREEEENE